MDGRLLARVPSGGRPVYAFKPAVGSCDLALLVSPEEWDAVTRRGWGTLDGNRAAVVHEDCDRDSGMLRLRLDRPYEVPA